MQNVEWDGNGIPPVGAIVEYCGQDGEKYGRAYDEWENGDNLKVLSIELDDDGDELPIVYNIRHRTASGMMVRFLRPIKSEREKAIDEMLKIANEGCSCLSAGAAEKLYDAGYRKT